MRHLYPLYIILLLLLPALDASGQNLVPNGDFEQPVSCPTGVSQMSKCNGWRQYHQGTSDYFNVCNNTTVGVPLNIVGYQYPAHGNAYAGFYTYNGITGYKEYIAGKITSLIPGELYEVSMSVTLSDKSGYTTADIGAWFYQNGPSATVSGNTALPVTPQVSYNSYGYIADTVNWIRVKGTFIADSAYDNIVIGGFGTTATTSPIPVGSPSSPYAYFWVDSVVVRRANINYDIPDTAFCAGDSLILPFTVYPGKYTPGNIFFLQLSDVNGSFNTPTIIDFKAGNTDDVFKWIVPGSIIPSSNYRIRIVSTSVVDSSYTSTNLTIGNVLPGKPSIGNPLPVCEGDSLRLTATSPTPGVVYAWSGPVAFWSKDKNPYRYPALLSHSGRYTLSTWLYGCAARDTFNVNVVPTKNVIHAISQSQICANDTLKLFGTSAAVGTTKFSWTGPKGFTSTAKDTFILHPSTFDMSKYILTGNYSGCTSSDSVAVLVVPVPQNFSAGCSKPICEGDTLLFSAYTTSPGVIYQWTGPNFSAIIPYPGINGVTTQHSGKYIISATLGTCAIVDTVTVNVIAIKDVIKAAIGNSKVCEGDTIKLFSTSSATGSTNFSWTGPGNFTSNISDPIILSPAASASGDYIVKGSFSGCSWSDTVNVLVKPVPTDCKASYDGPVCEGATLHLTGAATGAPLSFSWSGPGNFTATQQQVLIDYAQLAQSGNYILTAAMDGCTASNTLHVLVKPNPEVPVIKASTPLVTGSNLSLRISNIASGVVYSWAGPAGFKSALLDPVIHRVTKNNAGWYTVTATQDGCSADDSLLVNITGGMDSILVYPNANNGNFTIRGFLSQDQQVLINMSSSNGQMVYEAMAQTQNKLLDVKVSLPDAVSSGVYTLRFRIDGLVHVVRVVIDRNK